MLTYIYIFVTPVLLLRLTLMPFCGSLMLDYWIFVCLIEQVT